MTVPINYKFMIASAGTQPNSGQWMAQRKPDIGGNEESIEKFGLGKSTHRVVNVVALPIVLCLAGPVQAADWNIVFSLDKDNQYESTVNIDQIQALLNFKWVEGHRG